MSDSILEPIPVVGPKKVPAKNACKWMYAAWIQFKTFPVQWSAILLLDWLILYFMPSKSYDIFRMLFCAGLFMAAWTGDQKRAPRLINDYLAGFQKPFMFRLLMATFVMILILIIPAFCIIVPFEDTFSLIGKMVAERGNFNSFSEIFSSQQLDGLVLTILIIVVLLFSYNILTITLLLPALIIFHRCSIWSALRLSFLASLRNWRALTVYWLISVIIVGVLCLLAVLIDIYVLWGLALFSPIFNISLFYMWKDMFSESIEKQNEEKDLPQLSQFDLRIK